MSFAFHHGLIINFPIPKQEAFVYCSAGGNLEIIFSNVNGINVLHVLTGVLTGNEPLNPGARPPFLLGMTAAERKNYQFQCDDWDYRNKIFEKFSASENAIRVAFLNGLQACTPMRQHFPPNLDIINMTVAQIFALIMTEYLQLTVMDQDKFMGEISLPLNITPSSTETGLTKFNSRIFSNNTIIAYLAASGHAISAADQKRLFLRSLQSCYALNNFFETIIQTGAHDSYDQLIDKARLAVTGIDFHVPISTNIARTLNCATTDADSDSDTSIQANGVKKSKKVNKGTLTCDIHGEKVFHNSPECYVVKLANEITKLRKVKDLTVPEMIACHRAAKQ